MSNIKDFMPLRNYYNQNEVDQKLLQINPVPPGVAGQSLFIKANNSSELSLSESVVQGAFVYSADQLSAAMGVFESNEVIFNTWGRFSHNTTEDQPASVTEVDAWTYDPATDRILCTVNSATHIGFYSSKRYATYEHEVLLKSAAADNDMIGAVIAFMVDENGREHTLTALRTKSAETHLAVAGSVYSWAIVYNYQRSDAKVVANGSALADSAGATHWSTVPHGTRVRVHRDNDIITAWTSQFSDTNAVIDPATEISVDLTSDPDLYKFRGPHPYGYSALSQTDSTYEEIDFSPAANIIYDVSAGKVYTADASGNYAEDPAYSLADIGPGRTLYNPATKALMQVNYDLSVTILRHAPYQTRIVLAGGASETFDVRALFGESEYATSANVRVLVLDTDDTSPTHNKYINSEAVVTVGVDNQFVTVYNETGTTVSLDVLITL